MSEHRDRRDDGFTMIEVVTSVAVLLVVLTAAWLLLIVSSQSLNAIEYGGQATESNRAALAYFERDVNRSLMPLEDISPVLDAAPRSVSFLADGDRDGDPELVTWKADDVGHRLLRVVTDPSETTHTPTSLTDFIDGTSTTEVILTGLTARQDYGDPPMFTYGVDALTDYDGNLRRIGIVTFRLSNGLPDGATNVSDRTGTYRFLSLVINGY